MKIKKAIEIYNKYKDDEKIKNFEIARSIILKEMNNRKPEREFYMSTSKGEYYIEKPYKELYFGKNGIEERQRSYSVILKTKKSTLNFCLSLCGYSKEDIIKIIEKDFAKKE